MNERGRVMIFCAGALTLGAVAGSTPLAPTPASDRGTPSLSGITDCNNNGVGDARDIDEGVSADCNLNAVPDECDIAAGTSDDCNADGIPDECSLVLAFVQQTVTTEYTALQTTDVADLDGDGDVDVLTGHGSALLWYPNLDGQGTFGSLNTIADSLNSLQEGRAADLDGDGDFDVLVSVRYDDVVGWYENTSGAGAFAPLRTISNGVGGPVGVVTGDLDGDGDADVIARSQDDPRVTRFENTDGAGGFAERQVLPDYTRALGIGDLDGDGDLDVAATADNQNIAWYENLDGAGTLATAQDVEGTGGGLPAYLIVTDLDLDGLDDIVYSSFATNFIAWVESTGLGAFGQVRTISGTADSYEIAAVDLDRDGDPDIVSANGGQDGASYHENSGNAQSFQEGQVALQLQAPYEVASADIDGNLAPDLVTRTGEGLFWGRNTDRDCDGSGIPDDCETDCDANGLPDACETLFGADDCNDNGVPDACDVASGASDDCAANGIPDECEPDCNANGVADGCDIDVGFSQDCTLDGVPDECEPDCNDNGEADSCDIDDGISGDCDADGVPDECEPDCNANGTPDDCDILSGSSGDCNDNGLPDDCDVAAGPSPDCDGNGVPDECEPDCNANGVADGCDIVRGTSDDCSLNGVPDECEPDCNANGEADSCDIDNGVSSDCAADGIPDDCQVALGFTEHAYHWSTQVQDVVVVDMDGDGDPDLVRAEDDITPPDRIDWFENVDGRGDFGIRHPISTTVNGPRSVAVADLDGDGDLDVAAAAEGDLNVAWYENLDGQDGFGPANLVAAGSALGEVVLAGDLDEDGDVDLLAARAGISWFANLDGLGTFGPARPVATTFTEVGEVRLADLDGDDDLDVVSGADNPILWYENAGTGVFGSTHQVGSTLGNRVLLLVTDLDLDGDLDAIASSRVTTGGPTGGHTYTALTWYANGDGQGNFVPGDTVASAVTPIQTLGKNFAPADVDGDGDLDIISGSIQGTMSVFGWYENVDGAGTYGSFIDFGLSLGSSLEPDFRPPAADLDGDGDYDLLASSRSVWYENTSDDCNGSGVPDACELAAGDCDGNGRLDSCEIALGTASDCDGNGQIDSCEVAGGTGVDCNANGILDGCELVLEDCNRNGVPDSCDTGCDDMSTCDLDGDQCRDGLDCLPQDPSAWFEPTAVSGLRLSRDGSTTTLDWEAPDDPGASSASYDTLRTAAAADFSTSATCVETDGSDTTADDPDLPAPGIAFFYLIRAQNDCSGSGALGVDSAGVPRSGRACP